LEDRFDAAAVFLAPAFALRPGELAARFALDAVARTDRLAVVIVARRPVWGSLRVAADAARRTFLARARVTVEPVGDTFGFLVCVIRAMRSCAADTPP
jgi:hypothetical protein